MKEAYIEDSAFVQSQVVMHSGVRRVEPLQEGEDLEDDEEDEDNPSLMQGGVCTKQSKSRMQPLEDEEIDDEMSALQVGPVVKTHPVAHAAAAEEGEEGLEEEDEYSAMQTSVVMQV